MLRVNSQWAGSTLIRTVLIAAGGVLLGFFFAKMATVENHRNTQDLVVDLDRPHLADVRDTRTDTSEGQNHLSRLLDEARITITDLKGRVEELEQQLPAERTPGEKLEAAQNIYDTFVRGSNGMVASEDGMDMLQQLHTLDPTVADFFMRLYEDTPVDKQVEREVAVTLALLSGGAEVAEFLNELLNDADLVEHEKHNLLMKLGGNGSLFSIERLPITGNLHRTAFRLTESEHAIERVGGAGLLSGVDTATARSQLLDMMESDHDVRVRIAAIRSLGRIGDDHTRDYLTRNVARIWQCCGEQNRPKLSQALRFAITQLQNGSD